ncbi:MAG: hypothetical protein JWP48_2878 [Actinoallomurus sp.]|jgi:hypothetical protein|nr:hypothetical protein [Actinoallomurus sp.]
MNDPRLDAETAERMLRGEATGPPELAELLGAASSRLATEDLNGEEAAVAAFRQKRAIPARQPRRRPLAALVSLKAAFIGLLLILTGGVTVAAASQHLPGPLGNKHIHSTQTSETSETRTPPRTPSPSHQGNQPAEPTPRSPHTEHSHAANPQEAAPPKKHPHPTKKPKSTPSKGHKRTALLRQPPSRTP